jgi:rRNA-processing protein FCF1
MLPTRFGINIFEQLDRLLDVEYQPTITKSVINELNDLKKNGKNSLIKEIDFALSNLSRYKIIEDFLNFEEEVDSHILKLAKENSYVVATTDSELRRRLRVNGIPVIYLRQKNHLALEGYIS